MDSATTPIYIIIGSILGILSAIVLIILHLPEFVNVIRSFLKWLCSWLRARPMRFNQWRYWRRFRLHYSVKNISPLSIEQIDDAYKMSISISLQYQNIDDLRDMWLYCDDMSLKLSSPHLKRAESYVLTYESGVKVRHILHHRLDKVDYTLSAHSSYKPILADIARCEKIYLGTVSLNNIRRALTAKSFPVSVDWAKTEIPESDREGSHS